MKGSCLDFELGRAVDGDGTFSRHQILSIEHNKKHDFHTLHYSVFYAQQNHPPGLIIPEEFVEVLSGKTPSDTQERVKMGKLFTQFLKEIRPSGPNACFVKKMPSYALTYDIHFTPDYQITGFGMRPTLALMKEHMSCDDALDKAFNNGDAELRLCHDFALSMNNPHNDNRIPFSEVTTRITNVIQRESKKMAFKEGIDCVYHMIPDKNLGSCGNNLPVHRIGKYAHQFGSVLSHNPSKDGPKRALVSNTASRNANDSFNIAVISEFLTNDGCNAFPKEVAKSVAKYNHHLIKWQMNEMWSGPRL